MGDPYDEDSDGGGTDGYVNACGFGTGYGGGGLELSEADEGGVV